MYTPYLERINMNRREQRSLEVTRELERKFALDGRDIFYKKTNLSHFHESLGRGPNEQLKIVKRYLDQGISPDWPTQEGTVGLHIAARNGCRRLARLLVEYGADVTKKDSQGRTPVDRLWSYKNNYLDYYELYSERYDYEDFQDRIYEARRDERRDRQTRKRKFVEILCTFVEAGLNLDERTESKLSYLILEDRDIETEVQRLFVQCVLRLTTIDDSLVSENLKNAYADLSNRRLSNWKKGEYASCCLQEWETLRDLGLRRILDNTIVVGRDFKQNFEWLQTFDFESYPIYGSLLKMRIRKRFVEYEEKSEGIRKAAPRVQILFQTLCNLPILCAENILWNLSNEEIARLQQ